jgi:hypothetical protein
MPSHAARPPSEAVWLAVPSSTSTARTKRLSRSLTMRALPPLVAEEEALVVVAEVGAGLAVEEEAGAASSLVVPLL